MLTISREDIVGDYLMDYNEAVRYLKLPVDGYMDLLGIEPNSSQTAIINAINNPKYRFVCAAVSRRQGKTYIANIIGQLVSLVPNSHILLMSPNYSLSQISFDLQRNLIKHFGLEVVKDNAKDKVIELSNGSTVRMGSVNQVDSVVGRSYDLIIFDEAALVNGKDAFNVALRPTLDKENSKAIFISTPRGRNNWFADFYYRGFSDEYPEWASLRATYHENPRLSEQDILEARKRIDLKKLTKEKYNLVKKIQESFDINQFLSSPITNYKVMASIYKIFESQNKENYDVKDVFNSKYTIVEGLIGGELENKAQLVEDKTISEFKTQNKEERFLTYKVLLETFNKKHQKLNESQKALLKNYINNVSNTSKFTEYYTQQLKEVITQLVKQHKEVKDKVTKIKLKETINVLKKTKIGRVVSDNQVSAMMIAYELISEIKNVRNKA